MFKREICYWAVVLMATSAWAEENQGAKKAPLKQRVDPRVLRQALALPEYQGQPPETNSALLEDLQRLSDKLKKDGDVEATELLERFIFEHRRVVRQLASSSAHDGESLDVRIKLFKVNHADIPQGSILLEKRLKSHTKEIVAELARLITAHKAIVIAEPAILAKSGAAIRFVDGGEFPIPLVSNDGKTSTQYREFGTHIKCMPRIMGNDRVSLQITCETSEKDYTSAVTIGDVIVPGITARKMESTLEGQSGETMVCEYSDPTHIMFFLVTVTPSK